MIFTELLLVNSDANLAEYLELEDKLEPIPDTFSILSMKS